MYTWYFRCRLDVRLHVANMHYFGQFTNGFCEFSSIFLHHSRAMLQVCDCSMLFRGTTMFHMEIIVICALHAGVHEVQRVDLAICLYDINLQSCPSKTHENPQKVVGPKKYIADDFRHGPWHDQTCPRQLWTLQFHRDAQLSKTST